MHYYLKQAKDLAVLSSPLFLARLGVSIRGIIVTLILAKLGTEALSAGALVYSLLMVVLAFTFGLIMSSVGVSVAYAVGQKNNIKVTQSLQQGIWLGILLSLPLILLFQNIDFFLAVVV